MSLYSFSAVFTGTLNVPAPGPVTFSFTADDAFIFGVTNSATRVSGPQTGVGTVRPFNAYPVMGGVNQRSAVTISTITVNFPAAGVYPYEVDYAKGGDANLVLSMQAGGLPIPASTLLTISPSATTPLTAGQVSNLTVTATNADGTVAENVPVAMIVSGANNFTTPLNTGGVGQVAFSYAGSTIAFGTDQLQASAVINGAAVYSNVVTQTWNAGVNQAPVVGAGFAQTIQLPAKAVLSGSVSDDGLPSNTVTTTWTMQSGPGTVVFDNASQVNTAAAFSTAGTYVLQLSATDGVLSTSSTVAITVNANPNWSAGWLASPLNGATVSPPTPVSLMAGITLTSGTLSIYLASNPTAVMVLSSNTTGAGQIATFDPTLLANGSYFVDLRATNSAGMTQDNLALVSVIGAYKPGRVTATITDFTVPAPGLPIQIQRTYDSLVRSTSADFGYGWTLGVNIQTDISPTGDVTLTLNGQRKTFYFAPPPNAIFSYWYTPQYTAEPGFYGSLANTGDNCSGIIQKVGSIWECAIDNAGSGYQAAGFQYTDPYGRVYTMGANGQLQSVRDLNGNTLTITAAGITSSNGLNVPFVRDTQGRITQITDTLRNVYQYAYDPSGNLYTVNFPTTGPPITTTYGYDPTHLLTSEKDPNGHSTSSVYNTDGTLQSITDAFGQKTSYVYNVPTNTTTVTNPDGGTVTTTADSYGMPLSATDPLGNTTTNTYDSNHNLLSVTDPLGHTNSYTYDASGNRTSTTYPRTSTSVNTTSSTTYNQYAEQLTKTDELGNVQTFSYDANHNPNKVTDTLDGALSTRASFTVNANGTIQSKAFGYDLATFPNKAVNYT